MIDVRIKFIYLIDLFSLILTHSIQVASIKSKFLICIYNFMNHIFHIFQNEHTSETIYNEGTKYITTKFEIYVFIVSIYQYAAPLLYLTFAYSKMSYTLSKVLEIIQFLHKMPQNKCLISFWRGLESFSFESGVISWCYSFLRQF